MGVNRVDADHPAFFRWHGESTGWEPFQNNYGGKDNINFVCRLESAGQLSDTLFTRGCVARSYNGGKSWDSLSDTWNCSSTGLPVLLFIDSFHPEHIWMGGVTGISQAYLFKSDD